jgi:PAS domain S-box-containing protein
MHATPAKDVFLSRPIARFTAALLAIWLFAAAGLFGLNGFHYDLHALTLGFLLVFGCGLIVGASHLLSVRLRERERAEAMLKQSRESYSSLVENSLTGIFITQGGRIRFSNRRFAETHGFGPEEIVGLEALDLVSPEDRPRVKEIGDRLLSGVLQDHIYEVRCLTRNGRTVWVQRRSRRVLHEDRPAIIGNEIDISEQKLAAAKIHEANQQITRLLGRFVRQQEQDRKAIAVEIQEDFAQSLNAIKMRVESLMVMAAAKGSDTGLELLKPIIAEVQQTVGSIRRLAEKLHPMAVDAFGITAALRWLFDSQSDSHPEFRIHSHLDVEDALVPDDLKIAVFRMVEKILSESIDREPRGVLKMYLQGFGSHVVCAIQSEGEPQGPCDTENGACPESLEVADLRTRIDSCGGHFSLSHQPDGIRFWSSWPLPLHVPPNPDRTLSPPSSLKTVESA